MNSIETKKIKELESLTREYYRVDKKFKEISLKRKKLKNKLSSITSGTVKMKYWTLRIRNEMSSYINLGDARKLLTCDMVKKLISRSYYCTVTVTKNTKKKKTVKKA